MYLLDSNFFITAQRQHYPIDIVPSFWGKVSELAHSGQLQSIDKVHAEITKGNDFLPRWIHENLPHDFFHDSTQYIGAYAEIAKWAYSRSTHFTKPALDEFLNADEADAWLIAASMERNFTIITHEISQPERKNKIKIPEPCNHFDLKFCDTITMFRTLGVTL